MTGILSIEDGGDQGRTSGVARVARRVKQVAGHARKSFINRRFSPSAEPDVMFRPARFSGVPSGSSFPERPLARPRRPCEVPGPCAPMGFPSIPTSAVRHLRAADPALARHHRAESSRSRSADAHAEPLRGATGVDRLSAVERPRGGDDPESRARAVPAPPIPPARSTSWRRRSHVSEPPGCRGTRPPRSTTSLATRSRAPFPRSRAPTP